MYSTNDGPAVLIVFTCAIGGRNLPHQIHAGRQDSQIKKIAGRRGAIRLQHCPAKPFSPLSTTVRSRPAYYFFFSTRSTTTHNSRRARLRSFGIVVENS